MTKKRSTKRALLLSALSLLMCVSMLVGSTFAWFTDSVVSGSNIIKSGKLEVALLDKNGNSLEGKPLEFVDQAGNVLTNILWEPGCTYTLQPVFVKNIGNLAMKYEIVISGIEGNAKLLEAIEWTVEGAALKGTLEPGAETAELRITGHMKEEAGNEYQNLQMDGISITVYATQYTSESDSFGKDYDKDAIYTDVVVTSEEELKEALANAKDGTIIGIRGNVTWTTGAGIGSTPFIEAASTYSLRAVESVKNITLVGMNETATFTAIGKGVGAIGIDGGTVTFKNLKLVDESVSYAENNWEYGYLEFRGNTVFEDCNIVNAIMMDGDSATFKNCFFNSNKDNEYAVWVSNGKASFVGCTFNGARGLKIHEAYGSEVDTIVVNNNMFIELSKKPGMAIGTVNADTTITLTNNKFFGTQAGDQGLFSYETDTDITAFKFNYENNIVAAKAGDDSNDLYKSEKTYYATSSEGLLEGAKSAGADETIILATDITTPKNTDTLIEAPAGKPINVDGNGATITTNGTGTAAGSSYDYGYVGFIPAKGEDATVSDLKVVGSGFVEVGHYGTSTGGDYTINNLVVEDLVATLAVNNGGNNIAAAFSHYGNATMTDCVMTGTTTHKEGFKPYDAAFVNGTKTTIEGGKYGVIYLAHQAHVTIKNAEIDVIDSCAITTKNLGKLTIGAGAKIGTINLTPGSYKPALVIEEGAEVGAIVYNGVTYTAAEWNAR